MTQPSLQATPITRARSTWRLRVAAGVVACSLALGPGATVAFGAESGSYTLPDQTPQSSQSAAPDATLDDKIAVDEMADVLEQAKTASVIANVKAYATQQRADVLEAMKPAQQKLSDQAARSLYKNRQNRYNIADMMLDSLTLDEFVRQGKYYESITRANLEEIAKLEDLNEEAAAARDLVTATLDEASANVTAAEEALESAQKERADKAAEGIAKSQSQATLLGGAKSAGRDGNGNSQGDFDLAATSETASLDDGADWYSTREQFIAEWAPRIDAYFEGSPLYGQGENFAKSAWKYCIDPRWSAAISNTESSKARVCIRPHNAWGWGAADSDPYNLAAEWDTWEEAIDAHARGLAKGYGYTISINGAKRYCPYTWQSWYNRTLTEMAKI